MAHADGDKYWYDDDTVYSSGRESDDSPSFSYRYQKYRRFSSYVEAKSEEREKRSTITVLAKFFLFCTAMILFCVLMYIPVYNKANVHVPKGFVAGWTIHTNRDTKVYVHPSNVTTIHEPKGVCPRKDENNKLFLLIVVCSSTINFDRRKAIRETWGNYDTYSQSSKLFNEAREKYKNYNFTYNLYNESEDRYNVSFNVTRHKRDISGFGQLLPELAKALQSNLVNVKTDSVEKRFDDDEEMLPEFDMNKELGDQTEAEYDFDYESNVMKIPPRGYEDGPDLGKILKMLKFNKNFPNIKEELSNEVPDYKVVFLLGLPAKENDTGVQSKIEEEVEEYGDVIQEGFIDSYNNLTLKSIMMLKWITNKCNESVRYVLKTDDDMYINVPNLMNNLRNRSRHYDEKVAKGYKEKEYLLIGDLICGASPVQDSNSKWYSPRYMYGGRVYPRYLSGTGYVLSAPAARALYSAALRTSYFHLEDVYITGMCSVRASPRLYARDDPDFTYQPAPRPLCAAHWHATAHRVAPADMTRLHRHLLDPLLLDKCERMRLTQVRRDRLRPKHKKRIPKHSLTAKYY